MMQFGKRVRMMMEKKKRNEWGKQKQIVYIEKLKFLGPNHLLLYFQNQQIGTKDLHMLFVGKSSYIARELVSP